MKFVVVQNCPCPAELAPVLERIAARCGCYYASIFRGVEAETLLRKCGKHSQTWLYEHQGTPEQPNPANRPGQSTHECRSDGRAYRGPVGRRLAPWQCGIDVDDAHVEAFIREAAREGFTASVTYPGDPREYHHVNFRKQPKIALPPLKLGSAGPRVVRATWMLHRLGYLPHKFWRVNAEVEAGIKKFQREHRQKSDGKWGVQTFRAAAHALRS